VRTLLTYDWPGNLRELNRVVEEARRHGEGLLIDAVDLPAAIRGHLASAYAPQATPPPITPLDELLAQIERRLIENALQRARQNKSRAAELLGISRPRLYRRIKELGLPDELEPSEEPALPSTAPDGRE
jgi:DNA-binding NtrC family response regulator